VPPGGMILLVDKPEGPTSHDVVNRVRRAWGTRRVGHTGTLDPFASGLLVICLGEATRLSQYLTGEDKAYVATARLGVRTDTLDRDGEVVQRTDAWDGVTREMVEGALAPLRGEISQLPPRFSAKKVGGRAAHRLAREGEVVELQPSTVTVHELVLEGWTPPDVALRVRCSSGTYIRALARDLGDALGVGAHLTRLRRTRVGNRSVDSALDGTALMAPGFDPSSEGAVPASAVLTPLASLERLVPVPVSPTEARELVQGRQLPVEDDEVLARLGNASRDQPGGRAARGPDGKPRPVAAAHVAGQLLALCALQADRLRPVKVFPGALEAVDA
jgi:tRNA pseudouridine55 synthase